MTSLFCGYLFLDLYHGNTTKDPKFYRKPYNSCFCCLFWVGVVALYLFEAPRESSRVEPEQESIEYSNSYYSKYWVLTVVLSALWCLGKAWCEEYGAEDIVFRPPGWDVEKQRNPALQRSAL